MLASFVALVGGVGRNRGLDQGLGFRSTVIVLRFVDVGNLICSNCDIKELYLLLYRILFRYKFVKRRQFNIAVPLFLGCCDMLILSFVVGG